jgi:5'-3' exonuclease
MRYPTTKKISPKRINMQNNTLCLIDGSSLLFRSYYGVRPLHTAKGEPTHAIYGFCRALKKISDDLKPTHMVIVWDTKGPTFRHEQFSEYKATRQAPPSDLLTQKTALASFIDMVGFTLLLMMHSPIIRLSLRETKICISYLTTILRCLILSSKR